MPDDRTAADHLLSHNHMLRHDIHIISRGLHGINSTPQFTLCSRPHHEKRSTFSNSSMSLTLSPEFHDSANVLLLECRHGELLSPKDSACLSRSFSVSHVEEDVSVRGAKSEQTVQTGRRCGAATKRMTRQLCNQPFTCFHCSHPPYTRLGSQSISLSPAPTIQRVDASPSHSPTVPCSPARCYASR